MALPSSGQISLSAIIAEFGGGTKLTDFYRGGAYVADTAANAGVPTTGQIKITDFYGASAFTPLSISISGDASDSDLIAPFNTTSALSGVAAGGSGTKSYAWTYVSGSTFTVTGGSTASATFTRSGSSPDEYIGTYRCTVTDSSGSAYADVQIWHVHGSPQ